MSEEFGSAASDGFVKHRAPLVAGPSSKQFHDVVLSQGVRRDMVDREPSSASWRPVLPMRLIGRERESAQLRELVRVDE